VSKTNKKMKYKYIKKAYHG